MTGLSPFRKLTPKMGDVIQLAIEKGYDQFISLVANERNMTKEAVDKIAQGRVWSGKTAQQLGLVDKLGYLDDAIESAAQLAKLGDYDVRVIKKRLSPIDQMMQNLFSTFAPDTELQLSPKLGLMQIFSEILEQSETWTQFNDPMGMYVYCMACDAI